MSLSSPLRLAGAPVDAPGSPTEQALRLRTRLVRVLLAGEGIEHALSLLGDAAGTRLELELAGPRSDAGNAIPLRVGAATLGWLQPAGGAIRADREIVVAAGARVLALAIRDERERVRALAARPAELLAELLQLLPDRAAHAARIAAHAGLRFDRPLAVLCVATDQRTGATAVRASAACALVCDDDERTRTLVVAPGRDPRALASVLARNLRAADGPGPTIGFDDEPVELRDLVAAVQRARRALDAATSLRREGEAVAFSEIGVDGALATCDGDARARAERLLRPLLDYDAEHGTSLIATLEAFLEEQARPARAARRLFLHPNSLAYRLKRIEGVAGVRLDDPDTRFQLELAMRTHR